MGYLIFFDKNRKIRKELIQKFKDKPLFGFRNCSLQFQIYKKKLMEAKEKKKR